MPLESTMLEHGESPTILPWLETYFDFARLCRIGLGLPSGTDLPGQPKPMGRVPDQHPAPVRVEVMGANFVAPPAGTRFEPDALQGILAPRILPRPPLPEPFGEEGERLWQS